MHSYEDRIRAVKLYIKLGKRAGATIRQLGYPTTIHCPILNDRTWSDNSNRCNATSGNCSWNTIS